MEYIQEKHLLSALCLRPDKPGKIFVRNARGREEKLADSKAMFVVPSFADPNSSYDDIDDALKAAQRKREEMAGQIDGRELWELLELEDDSHTRAWKLEELSDLALGSSDAAAQSAMYRSLEASNVYFFRKGTGYIRRPQEQIDEIFARLEAEEVNKKEYEAISKWLLAIWENPRPKGAALEFPEGFEEAAQKTLNGLADVAVKGTESARFKKLSELLKSIDITRRDAPFLFMVRAGIWDENENLQLYENKISLNFEPDETAEAESYSELLDEYGNVGAAEPGRADLTSLECFTIDDASTTDIDDALSFEEYPDGTFRIGIHIADASNYVKPGSAVDKAALERSTAIYLPDLKVPMCPGIMSDSVCSLVAGKKRLAFSFLVKLSADFEITETSMTPSVIKVSERHTYESAVEALNAGRWSNFYKAAQACKARRQQAGAKVIPYPRVNVKVNAAGEILIEREVTDSPAQLLVSEMMILANSMAGSYLAEHQIPGIFRSQEPPEVPLEDMPEYDPVKAYNSRRYMHRGVMGLAPAHHTGLGLDNYVQVTSPIRRYNDLVMQRQLKSMLAEDSSGVPMYSQEELSRILGITKENCQQADKMEKDRRSFWLLRYLEAHTGEEMEAVVLANCPEKHVIQLCGCLYEGECAHVPGHPLPPGTHIHVNIDLVHPRDFTLRMSAIV